MVFTTKSDQSDQGRTVEIDVTDLYYALQTCELSFVHLVASEHLNVVYGRLRPIPFFAQYAGAPNIVYVRCNADSSVKRVGQAEHSPRPQLWQVAVAGVAG